MGICQHSLPQPGEKGGLLRLPVGPAANLRPASAPSRRFPLAGRPARRLCVKCRLREVPYNRGLGSPPARELGAGRGRGRGAAGGEGRLGSAQAAMELNSLLILLEAAEYLERRDRGTGRRRSGGRAVGPPQALPAAPGLCCVAAGPGRAGGDQPRAQRGRPGLGQRHRAGGGAVLFSWPLFCYFLKKKSVIFLSVSGRGRCVCCGAQGPSHFSVCGSG